MASSVSNLVNNLSERIRRIKCKYRHDDKKFETCGMKYMYCNCVFEYKSFKDHLIKCKCLYCNNIYERKFDQKLKERFLIHTNFLTTIIIHFIVPRRFLSLRMYG